MRAPYPVTLTQVDDNSIIVQVGCKTVVYNSHATLFNDIERYFIRPDETIAEFSMKFGWDLNAPPAPPIAYGVTAGGPPRF